MALIAAQPLGRRALTSLVLAPALALAMSGLVVVTPAHAATCPSSGGVAVPAATGSGDVVVHGHGWGHGLGMSQYGAQGAARLGCSAGQILTRYYSGTSVRRVSMPPTVLLRMLDNGYRADVVAQTGDVIWDLARCTAGCPPVQPRGSSWLLRLDASGTHYVLVDRAPTPNTVVWQGGSPGQNLRLRQSGTVVHLKTWKGGAVYLDRQLRWDWTRFSIDSAATGSGRLDAVQVITDDGTHTGMDKYLWGIAEMPTSWTNGAQEALKAQAIAARTYAAKRAGQVLMPTPADQNYTGYAKEAEDASFRDSAGRNLRWRAAVDGTTGQVVTSTSSGALIDTLYSSSAGGWTEDERFVWGVDSPFLRPIDDSRWEMASSNPATYRSWAKGFSWSTLAGRLGFQSVRTISVPARGSSARVSGVKVTGVRSGRVVTSYLDGWDVRQALGLPSPGFEISVRHIGGGAATPISGDWDGDGSDTPGWFRNGEVAVLMSDSTGAWVKRFHIGKAGDIPVVGDWNGDGKDDVGVFRDGTWYLRNGSRGTVDATLRFGTTGDRPVVGSWTGKAVGIGVVRSGRWLLRRTATPGRVQISFGFGRSTDRPVVGDWNGDGTTTVGVRRVRTWLLRDRVSAGGATRIFRYGLSTDRALAGDWDGDGVVSAGVVRGRTFYLRHTRLLVFRG